MNRQRFSRGEHRSTSRRNLGPSAPLLVAGLLAVTLGFAGTSRPSQAADLTVEAGVVVKFGPEAELVVRDRFTADPGSRFTSLRDDSIGGQSRPTAATPAPGDWRGIVVDPVVQPSELSVSGVDIRFAGHGGNAALALSRRDYQITGLMLQRNLVGLAIAGGSPELSESSLLNNAVGVEVAGATPRIESSEFVGNQDVAIRNQTPTSIVMARGNWWGAPGGPTESGNPGGTGDRVSSGVDYGQFRTSAPLIDCAVVPADGRYAVVQRRVWLALRCRNASEARISESASFVGAAWQPFAATTEFMLSPAAGTKTLHVEFRGAAGQTRAVATTQPFVLTLSIPQLSFITPAANATITANSQIAVSVTEPAGLPITRVDFFAGATALGSVTSPPYQVNWDITGFPNAPVRLRVVATNSEGRTGEATRDVSIQRPDAIPPAISSVRLGTLAIADGVTVTAPGTLTATITDDSAITTTSLRLDGNAVSGASFSGGQFTVVLDFATVANGNRVLRLEARDVMGNIGVFERTLNVQIPPPPAPAISAPANGATVQNPQLTVSGNAQIGSRVQLYRDGSPVGSLLTVSAGGSWSGSLTLLEGQNRIAAEATNARGTSARTPDRLITYQVPSPQVLITAPAEFATVDRDTTITAAITDPLGVQQVRFLVNGQLLRTDTQAPFDAPWAVAALPDGVYTLRVEATNLAARTSSVQRTVTLQKAPPPPPPFVAPYLATNVVASPASSFGERPITIQGRVVDRDGAPVGTVSLTAQLRIGGFTRRITLVADSSGDFRYTFEPQITDAGRFAVQVAHPDEPGFTEQTAFTINRLSASPAALQVSASRGFAQAFNVSVAAGPGAGTQGVRLVADPADQPSGSIPNGISIEVPAAQDIPANGSRAFSLRLTGNNAAAETGTLILAVLAADSGTVRRGTIRVDWQLFAPVPALAPSPTSISTGLRQGQNVTEVVTIENRGLVPAADVRLSLRDNAGTGDPPPWIFLATTGELGNVAPGQRESVQVTINPGSTVADGVYNFRLRVAAANATGGDIPISVQVTQVGDGSARFQIVDIFTATQDAGGRLIEGVSGARVRLQNVALSSVTAQGSTDVNGRVTLGPLPVGTYQYRVSGPNHAEAVGRVQVRAATTVDERVFIDYDVVSVEWTVEETTIEDRYDIVLNATFRTEVPAPVVLIEPMSINLPPMQVGEVVTGELTITNYGLVRADNVEFFPPSLDSFYRIEVQGEVPNTLDARQRIRLPYRVTKLGGLPGQAVLEAGKSASLLHRAIDALAAGAKNSNCVAYTNLARLTYGYECANGDRRNGSASCTFAEVRGVQCTPSRPPVRVGGAACGSNGCPAWGIGGGGGGGEPQPPSVGCRPDNGCERRGGGGPGGGGK